MEQRSVVTPRLATVAEAATVARLLDAFNREYGTPTPGPATLTSLAISGISGTATIGERMPLKATATSTSNL